eukprot:4383519-Amphidinium_carterae.2
MNRHVCSFSAECPRMCVLSLDTPRPRLKRLSMHLPHVGHPGAERQEVLHHAQVVSQGALCIIGCDANAQVGSLRNATMAGAALLE